MNRAIFISETNGAAEENTHGLVRCHSVSVRVLLTRIGKKHASKEQPEGSAPDFALDRVQSLVRCFLMKPEGHSNMCSLAKGCVLRRVMALTEVVHTITEFVISQEGWDRGLLKLTSIESPRVTTWVGRKRRSLCVYWPHGKSGDGSVH